MGNTLTVTVDIAVDLTNLIFELIQERKTSKNGKKFEKEIQELLNNSETFIKSVEKNKAEMSCFEQEENITGIYSDIGLIKIFNFITKKTSIIFLPDNFRYSKHKQRIIVDKNYKNLVVGGLFLKNVSIHCFTISKMNYLKMDEFEILENLTKTHRLCPEEDTNFLTCKEIHKFVNQNYNDVPLSFFFKEDILWIYCRNGHWKLFDFSIKEVINGPDFGFDLWNNAHRTLNDEYLFSKEYGFYFNNKHVKMNDFHSISNDGKFAMVCDKKKAIAKIYQTSMLREYVNEQQYHRKFMILNEIEDLDFSYDSKFIILIEKEKIQKMGRNTKFVRNLMIYSIEDDSFVICSPINLNFDHRNISTHGQLELISLHNSVIIGHSRLGNIKYEQIITLDFPIKYKYQFDWNSLLDLHFKFK
eukprot:gene11876-5203_t